MRDVVIPGTCGACVHYGEGRCGKSEAVFAGQSMWSVACAACAGYRRGAVAATSVDPRALAAVCPPQA